MNSKQSLKSKIVTFGFFGLAVLAEPTCLLYTNSHQPIEEPTPIKIEEPNKDKRRNILDELLSEGDKITYAKVTEPDYASNTI